MIEDKNKIAQSLSAEQLVEFLNKCRVTPHLTLERIAELAEEYGIEVSLMGARTFKKTTYKRHLDRIGRAVSASLRNES